MRSVLQSIAVGRVCQLGTTSIRRQPRSEGTEGVAAAPEAVHAEKVMRQNRFPPGWSEARVRRLLVRYEQQSDAEAVAEDEAAYKSTTATSMKIPAARGPAL